MMMVTSKPSRSRLWHKPAFPLAATTMSLTAPTTAAVLLLITISVSVSMSDGASVPISNGSNVQSTTLQNLRYNDDDDVNLELLASSKILMDHTSSASPDLKITGALDQNMRLAKNVMTAVQKKEEVFNDSPSSSSGSVSTQQQYYSSVQRIDRNSYEMSSPFHVARCRATCLQKFITKTKVTVSETPKTVVQTDPATSSGPRQDPRKPAGDLHLMPMLRLRKKRSSGKHKSCQDSADCLSCWGSCELFEPKDGAMKEVVNVNTDSSTTPQGDVNEDPAIHAKSEGSDENRKNAKRNNSKQSILPCTFMDSRQCLAGCQVACSFYEGLLTEKGKNEVPQENAFKSNPVVATNHESVVKIVPGKITWPSKSDSGDKDASLGTLEGDSRAAVYVVIQEYPDRKWRQIAQTTDTYIDIPSKLSSATNTKLRSVRVLVVGPNGLLCLYSPEKVGQETLSDSSNNNLANRLITSTSGTEDSDTTPTLSATQNAVDLSISSSTSASLSFDATTTANVNDQSESNLDLERTTDTDTIIKSVPVTESTQPTTQAVNESGGVGEPFGLRVVSLIHQKSLVIAELKWNEIGGPNQEYLITWELTGGGLKGHLVTDTCSVTLSLWPDTTYQIQVEQFQQTFDSDGEQPTEIPTNSLKSLPLLVDTNDASFLKPQPSALLSSVTEEEDEDDYEDEDVSAQEGNETRDEEDPDHKSITRGFLNMTLLLSITISALAFVLVILSVAAFTWTKMRAYSSDTYTNGTESGSSSPMLTPTKIPSNFYSNRKRCCYNDGNSRPGCFCSPSASSEPQPLLSQEEFWEDCGTSPVYYGMALSTPYPDRSCREDVDSLHYSLGRSFLHNKKGPESGGVAVISSCNSSSPSCSSSFLTGAPARTSCSYWNYYNKLSGSNNMAYSLLGDDCASSSGIAAGKQLEFPSSSSTSSYYNNELP